MTAEKVTLVTVGGKTYRQHYLLCPECGTTMLLKTSSFGVFYGCRGYPVCEGSHGARRDGTPLGTPADAETKTARVEAHKVFDKLWQPGGRMTRNQAYLWLQKAMAKGPDEAQIGHFSLIECNKLLKKLKEIGIHVQSAT
jgi:ssDNA-binding Zn-finger/Zn-ribbon topoisomerase 1